MVSFTIRGAVKLPFPVMPPRLRPVNCALAESLSGVMPGILSFTLYTPDAEASPFPVLSSAWAVILYVPAVLFR